MKFNSKSKAARIAARSAVAAALLVAVALPSLTGAPSQDRPEFEPIGDSVGTNGLPSRIRHTATGMVLVLIEPGSARLGSGTVEIGRDADEKPREIRIERPFYMGETEVSIGEWRSVLGTIPVESDFVDSAFLPVQGVSWYAAKDLVERMNALGSAGWRLPREDEWEYACRAGTSTAFSFGDALSPDRATYNAARPYADAIKRPPTTRPGRVRSHSPNAWGLYDMHANLWEWCEDIYSVDPTETVREPKPGAPRVLRGGSWASKGTNLRSASRDGYSPSSTGSEYGVRLVYSVSDTL